MRSRIVTPHVYGTFQLGHLSDIAVITAITCISISSVYFVSVC